MSYLESLTEEDPQTRCSRAQNRDIGFREVESPPPRVWQPALERLTTGKGSDELPHDSDEH